MHFIARAPADERPPETLPLQLETAPPAAVSRRDRGFRHGLLVADVLASLLVAGLTASWVDDVPLIWWIAAMPLVVLLVHAANGMYGRDEQLINNSTLDETPMIFHGATLVAVLLALGQPLLLRTTVHPAAVAFVWIGLLISVTACRVAARGIVRDLLPAERCLVVGDDEHGRRLARRIVEEPKAKVELAGVLGLPDAADAYTRLASVVAERRVHRVVIAADAGYPQQELQAIQAAKALGIKVSVVPRVLEVIGSSAVYDYIDGLTVLGIPRFGLSRASKVTKRTFDIVGSVVLLVLLAPLLTVIALAIKLDSPGPVLFRQARVGRRGERFEMLKFRSMQDNADSLKEA